MNPVIKSIIAQIQRLEAANAAITHAGGFFTAQQIANAQIAWTLKMQLRFDHGLEIGSY